MSDAPRAGSALLAIHESKRRLEGFLARRDFGVRSMVGGRTARRVCGVPGLWSLALFAGLVAGCPPMGGVGNRAPVASDGNVSVVQDTAMVITLGATDADAGDALTITITSLPIYGTIIDSSGDAVATVPHALLVGENTVTYTPNTGYTGPDSLRFRASDGTADSNEATVSIAVTELMADETISADRTVASLTIAAGSATAVENNAVVTVTGDATIDGILVAERGLLTLVVEGDLTINGALRANDAESDPGDGSTSLGQQPFGIHIILGDGALTIGPNATLQSTGPIVITDDPAVLDQTANDLFDEVEDVSGDDLPTLVPLPDNENDNANGVPKTKLQPVQQGGVVLPPVVVSGTWPPAGAPAPRGDRPIIIFRFMGNRPLELNGWTVRGPAAPDGADADQGMDEGMNANGANGKNGMRLNIRNNGGPINIVNRVELNLPNGGDGGAATAVCATARGGDGGNSGNFRMTAAGGINISNGTLVINPGRSGHGGAATVREGVAGGVGCPGAAGREGRAEGGDGHDNRKRLFIRGNVAGVANIAIGDVRAGDGGAATANVCPGGDGLICCDGGPGGKATAIGGDAGDASLNIAGQPVTTGMAIGGNGGPAEATGGEGGDGGPCKFGDGGDGGRGGDAEATGGSGGSATNNGMGGATSGNGGNAIATGGLGGDGGAAGLGEPGTGGGGGSAMATAGAAGPGGMAGQATAADGLMGGNGGDITVTLFCIGLAFVQDSLGAIAPDRYTGPVLSEDETSELGSIDVVLEPGPNVNYQRGDNPPHIGIGNGALFIDVESLQLTDGLPGVVSGLRITPLQGFAFDEANPLVVEALGSNGGVIGSRAFAEIPENFTNPSSPASIDAIFDIDITIAGFRVVAPDGTFVTILRVYLIDP